MAATYSHVAVTGRYAGRGVTLKASAELTTVAPKVYRSVSSGTLYTTAKRPSFATLERRLDSGVDTTPCGCRVELDGTCHHGVPSWMSIIGVI